MVAAATVVVDGIRLRRGREDSSCGFVREKDERRNEEDEG